MNFIKKAARTAYHIIRGLLLKLRGLHLLNVEQTIAFMAPYQVKEIDGNRVSLPQVINCADNKSIVFPAKDIVADRVYVWDYKDDAKPGSLSKYGSVTIRNRVLTTDFNYNSFYISFREGDKRPDE